MNEAPELRISVPGKVMLSGEYAVLEGAAAVMLPVPRWLHISKGGAVLRPDPQALGQERAEHCSAPTPESPVVTLARRIYLPQVSEIERSQGEPEIVIDSSELSVVDAHGVRCKLGLGSSAAETVGVLALRYLCAGLDYTAERERILAAALEVHERVQGGLGSGADIAACVWQRPLRFRRANGDIEIGLIAPPAATSSIPLALAWSGTPADSRALVRQYQTWVALEDAEGGALRAQLRSYSDELAEAWFAAPPAELFNLMDVHAQAMGLVADATGISWRLPAHARLEEWARRNGGRAKPTGAGGGDMVLLVGDLPLDKLKTPVIQLPTNRLWPSPTAV